MKNKLILIPVIVSIIFVACKEEKEDENPYSEVNIELSDYEKSFLTMNLGDTLKYKYLNASYNSNVHHSSTTNEFYIVSDIDTLKTNTQTKYTYALAFNNIENTKYKIVFNKTVNNFDMLVHVWNNNATPQIMLTMEGVLHHHDTLRINKFLYNDVYHIETDTTDNDNYCKIRRAFFAPNYGLISITDVCFDKYFTNL